MCDSLEKILNLLTLDEPSRKLVRTAIGFIESVATIATKTSYSIESMDLLEIKQLFSFPLNSKMISSMAIQVTHAYDAYYLLYYLIMSNQNLNNIYNDFIN